MIPLILLVLFVVGVTVLLVGWRGRILLSEPHCAKCGYDLRASLMASSQDAERRCPECGLDLNDRRAVHFGRAARRPRKIVAGLVLVGLPLLVVAVGVVRASMGLRWDDIRSDESVIGDLATKAGEPWAWRDLEQRYRAGSLDANEVAMAIDHLIAHIGAQRAAGQEPGPLPWSEGFVQRVDAGKSISDEQYIRLCHAYYGATPRIECRDRIRVGQPLRFNVQYGGHWDLPGVQFVKALRQIRLASTGETLPISSEHRGDRDANPDWYSHRGVFGIDGILKHPLPPGEHELIFDVDAGVLPKDSPLVAIDRKPGQMARWVRPRQTWSVSVPVKLTVVAEGQELVSLTEDPALDPTAHFSPTMMTRMGNQGVVLEIDYNYKGSPAVPVSFDVFLKTATSELRLGSFASSQTRQSYNTEHELKQGLAPEIRAADLILRPNPKHAEQFPGVKQVWGKPIVFENVRIDRYDLPAP